MVDYKAFLTCAHEAYEIQVRVTQSVDRSSRRWPVLSQSRYLYLW